MEKVEASPVASRPYFADIAPASACFTVPITASAQPQSRPAIPPPFSARPLSSPASTLAPVRVATQIGDFFAEDERTETRLVKPPELLMQARKKRPLMRLLFGSDTGQKGARSPR